MQATVIVSDHGTTWRHFPLVAQQGTERLYFFFDHRHTPQQRQNFIQSTIPLEQITGLDVLATDGPRDCSGGVHLWQPVVVGSAMVAARCDLCGQADHLEQPITVAMTIRQEFAEAG